MEITYTRLSLFLFLIATILITVAINGIKAFIILFNKQTEVTLQSRKRFSIFIGSFIEWSVFNIIMGCFSIFDALATILPFAEKYYSAKILLENFWQELITISPEYQFSFAIILNICLSFLSGYVAGRISRHDKAKVGLAVGWWAAIAFSLTALLVKAIANVDILPLQQIVQCVFIVGFATLGGYFSSLYDTERQKHFTWLIFGNVLFFSAIAVNYDSYLNKNVTYDIFWQITMLGRFITCLAIALAASVFTSNIINVKTSFENYKKWAFFIILFSVLLTILGAKFENHIEPPICCGDGAFSAWGYPYSFNSLPLKYSHISNWEFLALATNIFFLINLIICLLFISTKIRLWFLQKRKIVI